MQPQKNNEQLARTNQLKTFDVFVPTHAGKSIELIAKVDKESLKMYLCAMFEELGMFFKVPYKMEPLEVAKMVMMVISHDTYKTYTIEQYNDFCSRVKMGTLKGSDGKFLKVFNRFDVPIIFELLGAYNGLIENERELKSKDAKHEAIHNTKKLVGSLFDRFKELGLDTSFGKKKKVDKQKSREAMRHYNNFFTLWEAQGKPTDAKINYEGKRVTSEEYITLKTKP